MPQNGEINLSGVKALYKIQDIVLVDKNAVEAINEYRLIGEIMLSVCFTIAGNLLSNRNVYGGVVCGILLIFGGFLIGKSFYKFNSLDTITPSKENDEAIRELEEALGIGEYANKEQPEQAQ